MKKFKKNKDILMIVKFIIILSLFAVTIHGQNAFTYRPVPDHLMHWEDCAVVNEDEYILAETYLPHNYVKDGSIDYVDHLQKAIDENKKIIMPNFPVLINEKGLQIPSDRKILFLKNSILRISPNSLPKYSLLHINDAENIEIYCPVLEGDKYSHQGTKGEWGMGISIYGGRDVKIINPIIRKCWGDGLYISKSDIRNSKDITIQGGIIDDNRRNAISIISVQNLVVKDIIFSNTQGTLPMSGICIEPNTNIGNLINLQFENITTYNNSEYGFAIVLSTFIGKYAKRVSIDVKGMTDYYSKNVFLFGGTERRYPSNIKPLRGKITFSNIKGYYNSGDIIIGNSFKFSPQYKLTNFRLYKDKEIDINNRPDLKKKLSNISYKN